MSNLETENAVEAASEKGGKKKKSLWRKALKITLLTLLTLLFLVVVAVAVALYVIFTPEKVTGVINEYADDFLNADVQFENVDITFLSTFPTFYLNVNQGVVVSKALEQDSPEFNLSRDTLLCFSTCRIEIDPIKYLETKDLDIAELAFEGVSAHAYVDSTGKANWDMMLPSEPDTTASEFVLEDYIRSVNVRKVSFHTNRVVYEDVPAKQELVLDHFNLDLSGDFRDWKTGLDVDLSFDGVNLRNDTVQLASGMDIGLKAKLEADLSGNRYDLHSADLSVNENLFKINGFVSLPDTDLIDLDLYVTGEIPALKLAKQLIPAEYLPILKEISSDGKLEVGAQVEGTYGRGAMPDVKAVFRLENADFEYSGMDFAITDINLSGNAFLSLDGSKPSDATINGFSAKTPFARINAAAKVRDLLEDPFIDGKLKADANIGEALRYFPVLPSGMKIEGDADIDLNIKSLLSSVTDMKLEKVDADGVVDLRRFSLKSPADTLYVDFRKGNVKFKTNTANQKIYGKKAMIDADILLDTMSLLYSDLATGKVGNVDIKAQLAPDVKDVVTSLIADIKLNSLKMIALEDINLTSASTGLDLKMHPAERQPGSPVINCKLNTSGTKVYLDSILASIGNASVNLKLRPLTERRKAGDTVGVSRKRGQRYRNLTLDETVDYLLKSIETDSSAGDTVDMLQQFMTYWNMEADLNLKSLSARMDMLNYPIVMPTAKVTLDGRDLKFEDTRLKIGHSDLALSGRLKNIRRALMGKDKYKGTLSLGSKNLYVNELMNIMASDEDEEYLSENDSAAIDTLPMEIIVVPDNFDFDLDVNIGAVHYSKANFRNVKGKVALRNQYIFLDKLNFNSTLGDVNTTLLYKATDKSGADVSAELELNKLNITQVTTQLPVVDSMLPMLKSFEGLISTDIVALGKLDSQMSVDMPSMLASCYIRGDSLVLLDNETFRKLSKILLFKNKDKNLIDSLSLEFILKNGAITFFPFTLQMDRYKVGILGIQNVDMTFDYEFHVLKWPLLLKLLVRYSGDIDNLDDAKLKLRFDRSYKYFDNTQNNSIIRKQVQGILRKGRKDAMGE